jgi:hypothetical protein
MATSTNFTAHLRESLAWDSSTYETIYFLPGRQSIPERIARKESVGFDIKIESQKSGNKDTIAVSRATRAYRPRPLSPISMWAINTGFFLADVDIIFVVFLIVRHL